MFTCIWSHIQIYSSPAIDLQLNRRDYLCSLWNFVRAVSAPDEVKLKACRRNDDVVSHIVNKQPHKVRCIEHIK